MNSKINNFKKAHRFADYISVAMLYLRKNYLLENVLSKDDIKERILGHWGTVPGLNFLYQGLSILSKEEKSEILLITGPGHGAPAILANAWIEGTLSEFYKEYSYDKEGLGKLIHDFSWPGGFPSHTTPMVPGTIHEGGELGYSLATAFGAALGNPELIVGCIVGDGEAETGTLSASWHLSKFLNPTKDGTVLPILHLNGYRISGPTIYSTMNDGELLFYFKGLGYEPIIIDQYKSTDIYSDYLFALEKAYSMIKRIKSDWANYQSNKPVWPMLIFRSKKGWGGPKFLHDEKIEDSNLSHGIPLQKPKSNLEEFKLLKEWLESYKVDELMNSSGTIDQEIVEIYPKNNLRISHNKYALLEQIVEPLKLPRIEDHEVRYVKKTERIESQMEEFGKYLREIFRSNQNGGFKLFSPDESESNLLNEVFDVTSRAYVWPTRKDDKYFSEEGHIIELLSENVLFSMFQGYVLTGRRGVLISYEAFLNIISSQIDQHLKYLKQCKEVEFRKDLPSINLVSTSTLWRQEHNGYTHQNPTLINSMIAKHSEFSKLYFPIDVNSLLVASEESFLSNNRVNLITVGKRALPEILSLNEARELLNNGYHLIDYSENESFDIVLASIGDYQTNETLNAIDILKKYEPQIKIRFINFIELHKFSLLINDKDFCQKLFNDKKIILNFHGYKTAIHQLIWKSPIRDVIEVHGYQEEGTTTTPLDMQVLNQTSRIDIAISALNNLGDKEFKTTLDILRKKLEEHSKFIVENGVDIDI